MKKLIKLENPNKETLEAFDEIDNRPEQLETFETVEELFKSNGVILK